MVEKIKQMVHIKSFCDSPIQNGSQQRIMSAKAFAFKLSEKY